MKRLLIWLPIAALTFTLGSVAAAFFIRGNGLSDCVIKLESSIEQKTPARRTRDEVAEIYRAVLSEEGAIGLLHHKIHPEAAFLVYEDSYNAQTRLSKQLVKKLGFFGIDAEAIKAIKRPATHGGTIRSRLKSIPGVVLGVGGTPHVFDGQSDSWVPTDSPKSYGGLISLSDVVYNRDRSRAIVRFGVACGSYCGEGGLCVLRKDGETWQIVSIVDLFA